VKSHTFHFSDDKEDTAGGHEARQRQQLEVIQRRETGEASLSRHDLTRYFCINGGVDPN